MRVEPFALGVTNVIWTATDNSGNTATCEYTATVNDNEDPTIACPADVVVSRPMLKIVRLLVLHLGSPTTNDNCGIASTTNDAVEPFVLGVTNVIWTVTDNSGNTATCEYTVTVNDNEDPTITCPTDVVVSTDALELARRQVLHLGSPTTNDNCGVASQLLTMQLNHLP